MVELITAVCVDKWRGSLDLPSLLWEGRLSWVLQSPSWLSRETLRVLGVSGDKNKKTSKIWAMSFSTGWTRFFRSKHKKSVFFSWFYFVVCLATGRIILLNNFTQTSKTFTNRKLQIISNIDSHIRGWEVKIKKKYLEIIIFFLDNFLFRPTLVGGLYTQMGFLFSKFWPIDVNIVESCEWYH